MSVRDRIKLFEKSDSLTKPASVSPPCKRTSGVSTSIRKVMSEIEGGHSASPISTKLPSPGSSKRGSFHVDEPVAHEAHPHGSPEKPRVSPMHARMVSPKHVVDCHLVPDQEIEPVYYEMDSDLIESLQRINIHNTLNHSLILNKPLFPKPCMYTG